MIIEITKDEQVQLLACIESAIRSANNALQAAAILLPLAEKIGEAKEEDGNPNS
jgi:multidrug efflux pump subunit AcrA (membrane-fusion protein)